jgi:membrane protein DedA with SNARE-associated domain
MSEIYDLLVRHGAVILFPVVFLDQIDIPLPSVPSLLAAVALAVVGKMNCLTALVAATFGRLQADMIWFYLGRHFGKRMLDLLCRISFESDSCSRQIQDLYTRYLDGLTDRQICV